MTSKLSSPRPTSQAIIEALDGYELNVSQQLWRIKIYSVVVHRGIRLIQVGLDGPTHYEVMLSMKPTKQPREAVRTLAKWLLERPGEGSILTVP